MQTVIVLHSLIRWAVLLFGVLTLINALSGFIKKRVYTNSDDKSNLFFMISCDVQLLLGLLLYFNNGWFDKLKDLGNNMKNPYLARSPSFNAFNNAVRIAPLIFSFSIATMSTAGSATAFTSCTWWATSSSFLWRTLWASFSKPS